jgi:hypothetical protein
MVSLHKNWHEKRQKWLSCCRQTIFVLIRDLKLLPFPTNWLNFDVLKINTVVAMK